MDIDKLKVAELKEELKKRGLPHTGLKAVLAKRLKEAMGIPTDGNASFAGSQDSFNSSQEMSPGSMHVSPPNVGFTPQMTSQPQMVMPSQQYCQQSPMVGFHQGQVMSPQSAMQSSPILINTAMQQGIMPQSVSPSKYTGSATADNPMLQQHLSPQMLSPHQQQFYLQQPSVQQLRATISPQQMDNMAAVGGHNIIPQQISPNQPGMASPQPPISMHQQFVSTSEMLAADSSLRPDMPCQASPFTGEIDPSMRTPDNITTTSDDASHAVGIPEDKTTTIPSDIILTEKSDKALAEDASTLHQQYISTSEIVAEHKSVRPDVSNNESPAMFNAELTSNFVEPETNSPDQKDNSADLITDPVESTTLPDQSLSSSEILPPDQEQSNNDFTENVLEEVDKMDSDIQVTSSENVAAVADQPSEQDEEEETEVVVAESRGTDSDQPMDKEDLNENPEASPIIESTSIREEENISGCEQTDSLSQADVFAQESPVKHSEPCNVTVANEKVTPPQDSKMELDDSEPIDEKSSSVSHADIFSQESPAPVQQSNQALTSSHESALCEETAEKTLQSEKDVHKGDDKRSSSSQHKDDDRDNRSHQDRSRKRKDSKNRSDSYDISKERMKIYGDDYLYQRRHKSRSRSRSPIQRSEPRPKDQPLKVPDEPDDWDLRTDVYLDWFNSDLTMEISNSGFEAKSMESPGFETMWAGVRASYGVKSGKVFFEVKILENLTVPSSGDSSGTDNVVRVGWSVNLSGFALGEEPLSYGYGNSAKKSVDMKFSNYGEPYGAGDVIGAFYEHNPESSVVILSFSKNGTPLGTAFEISPDDINDAAMYPHVYIKNIRFEVNFGQNDDPWFAPPDSTWTAINKIPLESRVRGNPPPRTRADCEMLMMCGLPGAGKTHWAVRRMKEMPEKNYTILGLNLILEKMKLMGISRKRQFNERWDVLIERSNKCLSKLVQIAPTKRRNYILDQANVYTSAHYRKMKPFEAFRRIAVVVVPSDDELHRRILLSEKEEGKDVPENAVLEMKANFCIPVAPSDTFDDVIFSDLDREAATALVEKYNKEAKEKLDRSRSGKRDDKSRHEHRDSKQGSSHRSRDRSRDRKRSRFDSGSDHSSHRDSKEPRRNFSRFSQGQDNRDRGNHQRFNNNDRRDNRDQRNNRNRGGDFRYRNDEPYNRGDNRMGSGFRGGGSGYSHGGDRGRGGGWGSRNDNKGRGGGDRGRGYNRGGPDGPSSRGGFGGGPHNRSGGFDPSNRGSFGGQMNRGGGFNRGGFRGNNARSGSGNVDSRSQSGGRQQTTGYDDLTYSQQSYAASSMMYNTPRPQQAFGNQQHGFRQDSSNSNQPGSSDPFSNSMAAAQMYNMQHSLYYPNQPGYGQGGGYY